MYEPKKHVRQPKLRTNQRRPLEREMRRLQDEILAMGSLVSKTILDAVDILRHQDVAAAKRLIAADRLINDRRWRVEEDSLRLIATQHPLATDLRLIAAIWEIATELERIGDYAKGIAKITLTMDGKSATLPPPALAKMAVKTQGMLRRALFAFSEKDVYLAYATAVLDDQIDQLYNQIYHELIQAIIANPKSAEHANLLLWAAHNLERAGDRTLNICERVIFTVTGERIELDDFSQQPTDSQLNTI